MKLIVGLGNYGKIYENTRHNAGFDVLDKYLKIDNYKEKYRAYYQRRMIEETEVMFIKPLTFMNLSGNAVAKYVKYFNIDLDDILIIQDDLDMKVGTYKLKKNTSSGGHNGIKSIEQFLKTNEFARLKIGILNDKKDDTKDFVLGKFSKEDKEIINNIDTDKIINMFIKYGYDKTINMYKDSK